MRLDRAKLAFASLPDPQADQGVHEFAYALLPHGGDWRAAGVDREAEALNTPLFARPIEGGAQDGVRGAWAPFHVASTGSAQVTISAVKAAESGRGIVLRLVETHGGRGVVTVRWTGPISDVQPVDLLERPLRLDGLDHDGARRTSSIAVNPFQIITLHASV